MEQAVFTLVRQTRESSSRPSILQKPLRLLRAKLPKQAEDRDATVK